MKPAFSTVACPEWTLARLADRLEAWGYLGAELRTFGNGSAQFAFDPALTSPEKVRDVFSRSGVEICSLGTSIRFDAAVTPSVIGRVISDNETSVREAKGMIDLAIGLECPFVRVFGFELPEGEVRARGLDRVVDRIAKAADYCRNSGVKLMIENGGSFPTSADLAEIIDRVGSPMLVAAYSAPVGAMAGESVANAANVLGDRLVCVKIKDLRGGRPVALGEGELRCRESIEALAKAGFAGWVVYEFDRAWLGSGGGAENVDVDAVMTASSKALFAWAGQNAAAVRRGPRVVRA